jgi:hypothetical protein
MGSRSFRGFPGSPDHPRRVEAVGLFRRQSLLQNEILENALD